MSADERGWLQSAIETMVLFDLRPKAASQQRQEQTGETTAWSPDIASLVVFKGQRTSTKPTLAPKVLQLVDQNYEPIRQQMLSQASSLLTNSASRLNLSAGATTHSVGLFGLLQHPSVAAQNNKKRSG